ncbi:MAG: hypothetical protein NVSMB47_14810 [Polyangiales bacterium]
MLAGGMQALRFALVGASLTAGCAFGSGEVVRVHDGRARVERFVSYRAYAATREATLAEERGDWTAAVAALGRARDEDPDAVDLEARLGLALCHLSKREAAQFAFDDALRSSEQRERTYTARGQCRLLLGEPARAREDFLRAIAIDAEALEPTLALVALDLAAGATQQARARAEEAAWMHPTSATAHRILAEVLATIGDVVGAVAAARTTMRLDQREGSRARDAVLPIADRAGVASLELSLLGAPSGDDMTVAPADPRCQRLLEVLRALATRARAGEVEPAAVAVAATCPELESDATSIAVAAEWSPSTAETIEGRALASTSSPARRWAQRMRLRRLSLEALLAADTLPRPEDAPTLAIHVAARAVRAFSSTGPDARERARAWAAAARAMAGDEPTAARLAAEVSRRLGQGPSDPTRVAACALARTPIENEACTAP